MQHTDARTRLLEEGFAHVTGVLSFVEVEGLRAALSRSVPDEFVSRRRGSAFAVRDVLRLVPEVAELAHSTLRDVAREVAGEPVEPVKAILFDKVEGANWKIPWHQDRMIAVKERRDVEGFGSWSVKVGIPHVQPPAEVLQGIVAVRLFLDDQGQGSGVLAVIPGSHSRGKLERQQVEQFVRDGQPVLCTGSAGDVLLLRPLLLHTSAQATRPGHRRVLHIEYSAQELPGGLDWYR